MTVIESCVCFRFPRARVDAFRRRRAQPDVDGRWPGWNPALPCGWRAEGGEAARPRRRFLGRRLGVTAAIAALVLAGVSGEARAQIRARGQAEDIGFELEELQGGKVRSPIYEVTVNAEAGGEEWFQLRTEYETEASWVDDLTFTYYALFRPDPREANLRLDPNRPYVLLRGRVAYINVPEGRHQSVMFIHPRTLARLGDVGRIAVVVSHQGRPIAYASEPSGSPGWWEQLSPVDGQLFTRHQTPFVAALSDGYEMIPSQ